MVKPQQPELRRTGLGATDDDSAKTQLTKGRGPTTMEGESGAVPEDNLPGHHPEHDQDKPDLDAFVARFSGHDRPEPEPEPEADQADQADELAVADADAGDEAEEVVTSTISGRATVAVSDKDPDVHTPLASAADLQPQPAAATTQPATAPAQTQTQPTASPQPAAGQRDVVAGVDQDGTPAFTSPLPPPEAVDLAVAVSPGLGPRTSVPSMPQPLRLLVQVLATPLYLAVSATRRTSEAVEGPLKALAGK